MRYHLLVVEGPDDAEFIGRFLKLRGLKRFGGQKEKLDRHWAPLFPQSYPKKGNYSVQLELPTVRSSQELSVAILPAGGSRLCGEVPGILALQGREWNSRLSSLSVFVDSDAAAPDAAFRNVLASFSLAFEPNKPESPGIVTEGDRRHGVWVFPDNSQSKSLETLLLAGGDASFPTLMARARNHVASFTEGERRSAKWKPFDEDKAIVASVASLLLPGRPNSASIQDNDWVTTTNAKSLPPFAALSTFLDQLLA